MEAATMAGWSISAPLFESILESLSSNDMLTFARGNKVLEEVSKWLPMLETIFAVFNDAQERRMTDLRVSRFIFNEFMFNELRDLAYDVDDVVDELITHAAQRQFRAQTETSSTKVGKLLRCGFSLGSRVKFSAGMVSKVKKLSQRLEDVKTQLDLQKLSQRLKDVKTQMDLPKNVGGRNKPVNEEIIAGPLPTSSLLEPKFYGREEDFNAILNLMTYDRDGGISVIYIVGRGGIGKTTLARMIYNDEYFYFDFKAWVSVGEDFDLITVTKTIVMSEEGGDLDSLQSKLRKKLFGKKFLIVLDNLWSHDYDKWTRFYRTFASGAPGSRIIITTRNEEFSLMTRGHFGYSLESLSDNDSLSLLAHHALGREDFSEHMELLKVGQKIVRNCKGLPLAGKVVGGLLLGRPYLNDWKNLLKDEFWKEDSEIMAALKLSYYSLPPPLKQCFAYCAVFPKEYEFDRDSLVLLWLAEGFFPNLSKGYLYFDELFARSLFQKSAKDASLFLMHDLIHDLARSINGRICLNFDEKSSEESYTRVRHSAYSRRDYDIIPRFQCFQHSKCLRTVLALPIFEECNNYISSKILDVWIPKLKLLRVLSLSGYKRVELPKSLSVLLHLRYLNLCNAEIVALPVSMSKLFNLQVLILRNCKNLRKLPRDFSNLINLQCVDLRGTDSLKETPMHIGKLLKLHILTKFIVGRTDGRGIQELLKIPNLQGHVHIKDLQNADIIDCLRMEEKEKIDELVLEWSSDFDVYRNEENEEQVLKALQPPRNVGRISIKSYGGREFPSWFGNESFKIRVIEIHNCCSVSWLPPLGGLPSLKELSIKGMDGVKQVGVEFYGMVSSSSSYSNVFPSLEILKFKDMENWKVWSCFENGHIFPMLRKLGIRRCPELVGDLPKSLDFLEELVIEGCKAEVLKHMPNLQSLAKLKISNLSGHKSFNVAFPETLKRLKKLKVKGCYELEHLWENGTQIEYLGDMKVLTIRNCAKLVSLVEGEEGRFPPNLQSLKILNCDNLERLPNELHSLKSLTSMAIDGCPKLTTLGDLPENLKELKMMDCDSVRSAAEAIMVDENGKSYGGQTSRIEILKLGIGKPLIIPSNALFPTSLRSLEIEEGYRWEAQLLGSLQLQNHLLHLTELYLEGCLLESFPATGLPIPTLLQLRLGNCSNLRSLPWNFHDLIFLEYLYLSGCPKVEYFPERGMPPNLSQLSICYCDALERQPLSEWRLDRLPLLQSLMIIGAMEMVSSIPHNSFPLPTSLTQLSILGFQNLKSMSSGLQTLTSLQHLTFWGCPKLQYLPKEGLPPSVGSLSFSNCPLMKRQCKNKYRSHLAHIPLFHSD